jgi:hypothetical protein
MMRAIRTARVGARFLLMMLALLACDRPEHYASRGLVKASEGDGDELRVAIHHERIAAFKDREGQVAPMPSMVMLFALNKGIAAPAPGAKLSFEFDVHWRESPTLRITQLTVLPEQTALTLPPAH